MGKKRETEQHMYLGSMSEQVEHGERVSALAYEIGKEMGLSERECRNLVIAGFFHDIGKTELVRDYTCKTSLMIEEMNSIREHPRRGYEILKRHGFNQEICDCVLYHHENYDGSGYPEKLEGWNIPMGACILRVCDVFCALTEDRPYRTAFKVSQALGLMVHEIRYYDLKVFLAFQRVLHRGDDRKLTIPEVSPEVKSIWRKL